MPDEKEQTVQLTLYIVRHGFSKTNAGLPALTPEENFDPYLTETGERQAELLGRRFAALPLDCIITSGLRRAEATADAVLKYQPPGGAHKMEINPIFSEWGITPDFKGRTIEEIKRDFPAAVLSEGCEGFERMVVYSSDSDGNIMQKTSEALEYLRNRFTKGENVMLVGHGKFNGFLIYSALGLAQDHPITFTLYNTGVTKIVFYKPGTGKEKDVNLVYLNDHSHLLSEYPDYGFIH